MGSLFIICLFIIVPATGKAYREYNNASIYYNDNCAEELGHLDYNYLKEEGCENKYRFRNNSPKDCGSKFDDCFETIGDLRISGAESKNYFTVVWE